MIITKRGAWWLFRYIWWDSVLNPNKKDDFHPDELTW